MSTRKSVSGRPFGTDGSDFSYRMVVDSRYQKVAQGKSRLSMVISTQALVQFLAAAVLYLLVLKGIAISTVSVYSGIGFFLFLVLGEIGRRRSRSTLLKFYLFGSSIAVVASAFDLFISGKPFEAAMKDLSRFNLSSIEVAVVLLKILVQIVAIGVATSLIRNMAPPKRAS